MKLTIQKSNQKNKQPITPLSLTEEEKKYIESEFLSELENEHAQREKRAQEKLNRTINRKVAKKRQTEKEVNKLKSELRKQFYSEKGYKLSTDPTGRVMWLSPTEQQSQNRRRGKKKASRLKKSLVNNKNAILLYGSIMLLACFVALYIVKS